MLAASASVRPHQQLQQLPLLILCFFVVLSCFSADAAAAASIEAASGSRCNFRQVQQMFDTERFGPDGCSNLKSLLYIFGREADVPLNQLAKQTAMRFLTANLVFTGTVTSVIKDASVVQGNRYDVKVQVHCYLKGRLSSQELRLTGLQADLSIGLCLDVNCHEGDTGLFFATYVGPDEIRVNENGFVKEGQGFEPAIRSLRCRQNAGSVAFWPAGGESAAAPAYCRPMEPPANATTCYLSVDKASLLLGDMFIEFEADLKPGCQEGKDFVMRRIVMPPVRPQAAFSVLSYSGRAAGPGASARLTFSGGLILLLVAQLATV